jgi:Spy/CpxP family protein refolding chaperone
MDRSRIFVAAAIALLVATGAPVAQAQAPGAGPAPAAGPDTSKRGWHGYVEALKTEADQRAHQRNDRQVARKQT